MCYLLKGKAIGRATDMLFTNVYVLTLTHEEIDSEDHRSVCALLTSKQKQLHDVRLSPYLR